MHRIVKKSTAGAQIIRINAFFIVPPGRTKSLNYDLIYVIKKIYIYYVYICLYKKHSVFKK